MPGLSNNQLIAKNTIVLYFRMLFSLLVSLYTSRIVLNTLGIVDFGIFNVVGGIVTLFTFINGSLANGTMRFIMYELGKKDFKQLNRVFSMSLTIHSLIAFTILILAETLGLWFLNTKMSIPSERLIAANWVYQLSIFTALINLTQVPYTSLIMAHEKMNIYAFVSIIEVLLRLAIVFVLLLITFDKLKLYAFLVFCSSALIALFYRYYCKSRFKESNYKFENDKKLFKTLTSFAGWNMVGTAAFISTNQGTNVLLNIFFGTVVNAAFGIANQVSGAIKSLMQNFMTAIKPQIVKSYAEGDMVNFQNLIFRSSKFSFYLLMLMSMPIFFETNYILRIWLKEFPEISIIFCRLILLYSLIHCFIDPFHLATQASGKIKWFQIIIGVILILQLPVSFIFLKMGAQPSIVFWVLLFCGLFSIPASLYITSRTIPSFQILNFIKLILIPCLIIFSITSIIISLIPIYFDESFIRLTITTISSFIVSGILIFYLGLDSSEKKYALELLNKVIRKITGWNLQRLSKDDKL